MNVNDGALFPMPTSSTNQEASVVYADNNVHSTVSISQSVDEATSTTCNVPAKAKSNKCQPRYRATKRPPSERRFKCDQCESRFFTQKDVKRHLVVHTGLRNFACPYCTQRFGRKDHLVRHAKKSHDQDTRCSRRQDSAPSSSASTSLSTESKRTRKATRSRKAENNLAVQLNNNTTASTITVTATSFSNKSNPSGYNQSNSTATTSFESYNNNVRNNNPIIMLTPTPTSIMNTFPKMTLVDNSSTSTFTASQSNCRNCPNSFGNYSSVNFNYNTSNNTFNNFMPETSSNQYPLHLSQTPTYVNYDGNYKLAAEPTSYNRTQTASTSNPNANTWQNGPPGSNVSFKTITSSIVDGFNTCIQLEYNSMDGNNFHSTSNNVPFAETPHLRYHSSFN